jgi:hypothetical protein
LPFFAAAAAAAWISGIVLGSSGSYWTRYISIVRSLAFSTRAHPRELCLPQGIALLSLHRGQPSVLLGCLLLSLRKWCLPSQSHRQHELRRERKGRKTHGRDGDGFRLEVVLGRDAAQQLVERIIVQLQCDLSPPTPSVQSPHEGRGGAHLDFFDFRLLRGVGAVGGPGLGRRGGRRRGGHGGVAGCCRAVLWCGTRAKVGSKKKFNACVFEGETNSRGRRRRRRGRRQWRWTVVLDRGTYDPANQSARSCSIDDLLCELYLRGPQTSEESSFAPGSAVVT